MPIETDPSPSFGSYGIENVINGNVNPTFLIDFYTHNMHSLHRLAADIRTTEKRSDQKRPPVPQPRRLCKNQSIMQLAAFLVQLKHWRVAVEST